MTSCGIFNPRVALFRCHWCNAAFSRANVLCPPCLIKLMSIGELKIHTGAACLDFTDLPAGQVLRHGGVIRYG